MLTGNWEIGRAEAIKDGVKKGMKFELVESNFNFQTLNIYSTY